MAGKKISTIKRADGTIYHTFNGVNLECTGGSCQFCKGGTEDDFKAWEETILFRMPPEGKRYKSKLKQKNRGKSIAEICYTCREIPCYICKRTKCEQWQAEKGRQGMEKGCAYWDSGRCNEFDCEKGLITTRWR